MFRRQILPEHRLFIAVDISDAARRIAALHIDDLRSQGQNNSVRWERPEKLHITLKFIGDTDDESVSQLVGMLGDRIRNQPPLDLRLGRPGVFPSRANPRVLWVGVEGDGDRLAEIHHEIEAVSAELGFVRDRRRFKPHLTIGRVRSAGVDPELIARHVNAQIEPVEFDVTAIAVYESRLQPTGSVYSVIARIPLSSQ